MGNAGPRGLMLDALLAEMFVRHHEIKLVEMRVPRQAALQCLPWLDGFLMLATKLLRVDDDYK